jgi:hypothetical protein
MSVAQTLDIKVQRHDAAGRVKLSVPVKATASDVVEMARHRLAVARGESIALADELHNLIPGASPVEEFVEASSTRTFTLMPSFRSAGAR